MRNGTPEMQSLDTRVWSGSDRGSVGVARRAAAYKHFGCGRKNARCSPASCNLRDFVNRVPQLSRENVHGISQ